MCERILNVRKIAKRVFIREQLSVPVDIISVLKKSAKIECDDIPFADAICTNLEKEPLIIYNKNTTESRLRFTLAHELGHLKIPWHRGDVACHTEENLSEAESRYRELEKEANTFASELLIPTEWLKGIVYQYKNIDLNDILNQITTGAKVSFLAALYAVCEVLPEGYYVNIERLDYGYNHSKTNRESDICYLKDKSNVCIEWLKINSINSGVISKSNVKVKWVYLADVNPSICIDRLINKYEIKGIGDVIRFFSISFDKYKLSPANYINEICRRLPSGYVLKIQFNNSRYYKYLRSNNTLIYANIDESSCSEDEWYNKYSNSSSIYTSEFFEIYIWEFESSINIIDTRKDNRNSKEILRNIVERYFYDDEQKIFGKVNGVIGALNSKKKKFTRDEFYNALKQRFIGRVDLQQIIEDEDFDKFLIQKTIELYSK